jgi:hypothetical protein
MKKIKQLLEKLEKSKDEIHFSILARDKFKDDCDTIFQLILEEISKLAALVVKKNAESRSYYIFEIDNVGSVNLAVMESDSITPIFELQINNTLSVKREKYGRNTDFFTMNSLTDFKEAVKQIQDYNRMLNEY